MSKLPAVTALKVIKKARKAGFIFDREAKGSHQIWYNPKTHQRFTLPFHKGKTLKRKTIKSIITQMGLTAEEFNRL